MPYKSRFFRSDNGDRKYTAQDWADYFKALVKDGVTYDQDEGLEVYCTGSDMVSRIKVGGAFIQGYNYEQDEEVELLHNTETSGNNRIDRVILRLDVSDEGRKIEPAILKGISSSNPVPPELKQDLTNEKIYEYSLAQVLIETGKAQIGVNNITKESEKAKILNSNYRQIFISELDPDPNVGSDGDIWIRYNPEG